MSSIDLAATVFLILIGIGAIAYASLRAQAAKPSQPDNALASPEDEDGGE